MVITKIEDPEELDTRFAKFSPFTDDNQNSLVSQLASEFRRVLRFPELPGARSGGTGWGMSGTDLVL